MSGYSHLAAEETDQLAGLKADGLSRGGIAWALGRAASTISRDIGRNSLESGAYRPQVADVAYRPAANDRLGSGPIEPP